jgi:hypothetical protein
MQKIALIGMFFLGLAFGQSIVGIKAADDDKPSIVKAQKFVLIDAMGKTRAELSFGSADSSSASAQDEQRFLKMSREENAREMLEGPWPRLVFFDANGKERIALGVTPVAESPVFQIKHADGTKAVSLSAFNSRASLQISAAGGNPSIAAMATHQAGPSLQFLDEEGNSRLGLALAGKGRPQLILSDVGERPRALLELQADASPRLSLFGEDKQEVWSTP